VPAPTTARSPRPSRRRRGLVAALGLALAAVVVTACVPPPPAPPAPLTPIPTGTHAVATRQFTFIDLSRPTPAFGAYPGSSTRRLPTTVWYPSGGGGPYPLVVFAHGYGATPAAYAPLLSRIAANGYVVAAPTYPLLSGQPAGPTDTVGWDDLAADTWFVTSQVLDRSASGDPAIGGLVDANRIAVAGHSDGAAIAFQDGYVPYKLDWRVRAVISYAADLQYYGPYQPNQRPILHFLSDHDVYNPYGDAIGWDRSALQPPKTVVSLWNASHEGPYVDPSDPHFELVVRVTIGWLDTVLKAHPEGMFLGGLYVGDHPSLGAME
jgi:dienelactone hydrolase